MMNRQTETGRKSLRRRLSASVARLCGRSPWLPPRAAVASRAPRPVFLPAGAIFCAALALAGCNTTSPQVQERVIAVPSSKPYRYIKPHPDDALTEKTLAQIERHNITHWKVKEAEKKASQ